MVGDKQRDKKKTGNVFIVEQVFLQMIVLEKELRKFSDEIDLVTTPSGDLVVVVHCNNCTSDLKCAWVNLFKEFVTELWCGRCDMDQLL